MAKNKYLALLAGLGVALALSWHFLWSSDTPRGQPPLTVFKPDNAREFSGKFNQAAANARMVLLLSPT